jgi:thioredoxin 1
LAEPTWIDATSDSWNNVVFNSDVPVVVDFWAPWCPYCKKLMPIFDELSAEYKGKMRFVKLNVEEEMSTAARYGVMSIPVLKFFCSGREVYELLGYMPKDALKEEFEKVLSTYKTCIKQSSTLQGDPMFA